MTRKAARKTAPGRDQCADQDRSHNESRTGNLDGRMLLHGLPPVLPAQPRLLILGSMPGAASLSAACYYAHPRNQFWPIMGALFGAAPERPYAERLQILQAQGIALWDVVGSCRRSGSLDSAIERDSVHFNPIDILLQDNPSIGHIICNGGTAMRLLRQGFRQVLAIHWPDLTIRQLPSTSPAHAAMRPADKLAAWREILDYTEV